MRLALRAGLRLGYWGWALARVSFGMGLAGYLLPLGTWAGHWGGMLVWGFGLICC